ADGKSCVVEFKDDDKTHRFDVNFATVGEKTIADFVPQLTEDEKAADPPKQAHHGFVIVEIKDHDTLLVSAMDYNWFKKLMETDPNTLKHEKVDTEYLLTTTTDELQAFLIKHFATAGAYGEAAEFKRAGATTKSSQ
ncbi:MAG TPA: hypothetical protein PK402_10320, partial [Tepidisphaeraceae bacterium]|nr:hypothetical protein [Tepidisphaeraceae bacterium]